MNTSKTPSKTFSDGLWIPAGIVAVSFVFAIGFMVKTINNYKKPRPLLIKPSSVETPEGVSNALYKALYPLKTRGFGVKLLADFTPSIAKAIASGVLKDFPENEKKFKLNAYKVSITEEHDNEKMDCLNTALFNLKRKPKRKWKKKIYFTVCTEDTNVFSIFYTTK